MAYQFSEKSAAARTSILNKLKQQVDGADYDKLPTEQPFQYPEKSKVEQLNRFIELLEANHAEVINVVESEIVQVIESVLTKRGIDRLLYGKDSSFSEVIESRFNDKDSVIGLDVFDFNLNEKKSFVFNEVKASFTSSKYAISETGTVVLWPSKQEPRTLSLIPPLHIVAVRKSALYPNFATLVEKQQWHQNMPTNVLLISGPSKTADIQQTLAFGAHGPKELIVLLIDD